jgi:hypothetical protein
MSPTIIHPRRRPASPSVTPSMLDCSTASRTPFGLHMEDFPCHVLRRCEYSLLLPYFGDPDSDAANSRHTIASLRCCGAVHKEKTKMPCSTASRTCLVRQKRHFPRHVLSQCEYAPVHLPFGDRYTDATNNRNIVVLPRLHGFVQKPTITDALLDCFQNMAFLCRGDTLQQPRSSGVSTSLRSPFRDRDSYATYSQVPAVFSGSVAHVQEPTSKTPSLLPEHVHPRREHFPCHVLGWCAYRLAHFCFCLPESEILTPPTAKAPRCTTVLWLCPRANYQDALLHSLGGKLDLQKGHFSCHVLWR